METKPPCTFLFGEIPTYTRISPSCAARCRRRRTNTITYTYDRSNRPVRVEDSTGACLEYAYDRKGRLISESSRLDGDTFREIRYMLDETGRVLKRYERLEEDAVYTGDMPYT